MVGIEYDVSARHSIADRIRSSLPPIEPSQLDPDRRELLERLPEDLRALLLGHNGGFVDSNEFTFATNCPAGHDGLQELYGFADGVTPDYVSVPHDFLDCHRRWTAEEFLPSGVLVFGSTMSDGLLCISTNDDDDGVIYYWDYYWQYPQHAAWWPGARERRGWRRSATPDPSWLTRLIREHQPLVDAANYATLSRVAGSFAEFAASTFEPDMDAWLAEHDRAQTGEAEGA